MITNALRILSLVLIAACARDRGNGPGIAPTESIRLGARPQVLRPLGAVAVPGFAAGTDWIPAIQRLEVGPSTRDVFALDRFGTEVVEFDSAGRFLRQFGGTSGGGPGEVRDVIDFGVSSRYVFLLDEGNAKTLVYDRHARLIHEFRSSPTYAQLAVLGERIFYMPSVTGAAFDVFSVAGERLGSVGTMQDLPYRGEGRDTLFACANCTLFALNASTLAVGSPEQSRIATFSDEGQRLGHWDFLKDNPIIRRWHATDEPYMVRAQKQGQEEAPSHTVVEVVKSYFSNFTPAGGGWIAMTVTPSVPEHRDRGYEYWLFNTRNGTYLRYGYPRRTLGLLATGARRVYALDTGNGGVYALAIPTSAYAISH
jgi:hypothetical protein